MTDYAIDVYDPVLEEEFPQTIEESLPEIAPVYRYISTSSENVVRSGVDSRSLGRDWKVIHLFNTGLAGLIQHAHAPGPTMETNTAYPQSYFLDSNNSYSTVDIFPTAQSTPHIATLQRELTLHMSSGNFSFPLAWFSQDALDANVAQQIGREIKAVGELRALLEAVSFFMPSNNVIGQINTAAIGAGGNSTRKYTLTSGTGNIHFFRVGLMLDIVDNPSGTSTGDPAWGLATDLSDRLNYTTSSGGSYIPLVVADVDYLNQTVTVAAPDGTNIQGLNEDQYDYLVVRDCVNVNTYNGTTAREMRTWGLEDWIAASGTILGGASGADALDLDTYSQFKSSVVDVSGVLTENVLNRYMGGLLNAYPGLKLDTLITTMGVTMKYLEQPETGTNRLVWDRNAALKLNTGWAEIGYEFGGRSYSWMISPMCSRGTLYGVAMRNGNIKRYAPPKVAGTNATVGGEVEFAAKLGGHGGIFKLAHGSDGQTLALVEAPFFQYHLTVPMDVRSLKLYNLTEATMV